MCPSVREGFFEPRFPIYRKESARRDFFEIDKIFMIFAAEMQNSFVRLPANINKGKLSMRHLPDHGLPLVQLKEQRRDLVVALQNHVGPISGWQLMEIAAIQQTISAFEEVIADLDAEVERPLLTLVA